MSGIQRKRQHERDGGEKCIQMSSLKTTFRADTVAFGTMFTVQSYGSALSVFSMELSAVPLDPTGMRVLVYTKLGDFQGFQTDPSAWDLVADTDIIPGREGTGSVIAEEDFTTVGMGLDETRSFYVTLATADLRYTRARSGVSVGDEFATDGYLSVHVGVGLGEFAFSNRVFDARLFNGIFHYRHAASCDEPMTRSRVTFSFVVGKSGLIPTSELGDVLTNSLRGMLQSLLDGDLSVFARDYLLGLETIQTTFSLMPKSQSCPDPTWIDCAKFDSTVTFLHRRILASGHAKYIMFQRSDQITKNLALQDFDIIYSGEKPLSADLVFYLEGVPMQSTMDEDQQRYFEEVITRFAAQELLGLLPVSILGTKIRSQEVALDRARSLRDATRMLQVETLHVSTSILGLYEPPAPDDFPLYVISAVKQYRDGLRDDLINSRDIPGSIVEGFKGDFFAGIRKIDARVDELAPTPAPTLAPTPEQPPTQTNTPKTLGIPTLWFILACVGLILVSVAWLWYYMRNEGMCDCHYWRGRASVRPARTGSSKRKRDSQRSTSGNQETSKISKKRGRRSRAVGDSNSDGALAIDGMNQTRPNRDRPASCGENNVDSQEISDDRKTDETDPDVPKMRDPAAPDSKRFSATVKSRESSVHESRASRRPSEFKTRNEPSLRSRRQTEQAIPKELSNSDDQQTDHINGTNIFAGHSETSALDEHRSKVDLDCPTEPTARAISDTVEHEKTKDVAAHETQRSSHLKGSTVRAPSTRGSRRNDGFSKNLSLRESKLSNDLSGIADEPSVLGRGKSQEPTTENSVRSGQRATGLEQFKDLSARESKRTLNESTVGMRSLLEKKTSRLDVSTRAMRGVMESSSRDVLENGDASSRHMKNLFDLSSHRKTTRHDESTRAMRTNSGDRGAAPRGDRTPDVSSCTRKEAEDGAAVQSPSNPTKTGRQNSGSNSVPHRGLFMQSKPRDSSPYGDRGRLSVSTHSKKGDMSPPRLGGSVHMSSRKKDKSPIRRRPLDASSQQEQYQLGASVHSKRVEPGGGEVRPDPPEGQKIKNAVLIQKDPVDNAGDGAQQQRRKRTTMSETQGSIHLRQSSEKTTKAKARSPSRRKGTKTTSPIRTVCSLPYPN